MARKNQRILSMLGAAVGTGLAVYGLRQGVRWYQRRQMRERFGAQSPEEVWRIQRPEAEPVPITGPQAAAPTMTGLSGANSDAVADFDDRGTAYTTSETDLPKEAAPVLGIVLDDYVISLIEHALAFNSLMNLLRSHQREDEQHPGAESLTEGDRHSMQSLLEQLKEHAMLPTEDALRRDPLALRAHRLTNDLHDALENASYSGADLFRLFDGLKKALCGLTRDLDRSGRVKVTGLSQIRELFECS